MKLKRILSLVLAITIVLSIGAISTLANEVPMDAVSILNAINLSDYAAEQISILSKDTDYLTVEPIELTKTDDKKSAETVEAFKVVATKQMNECVDDLTGETIKEMKDEVVILANLFSGSGSNGKYDVAYTTTVYYYLQGQLGNMQVKLNSVSGKIYDAGTNSIYCTKLAFRGCIAEPSGFEYAYWSSLKTVSNPSSNTTYSQSTVSNWESVGNDTGTLYELSFSNGTTLDGFYVITYR